MATYPMLLGSSTSLGKDVDGERFKPPNQGPSEEYQMNSYYSQMTLAIATTGLLTWMTAPISFILSWHYPSLSLYGFIGLKLLIFSGLQWTICRQLDNPPVKIEFGPLLDGPQADLACFSSQPSNLWDLCFLGYGITVSVVDFLLRFAGPVVTDADAMTPASAQRALNRTDEKVFAATWARVPVVGGLLGNWGLPDTLTAGLALVSLWQVYNFLDKVWQLRSVLLDGASSFRQYHGAVRASLFHLSDIAGLHLLTPRLQQLWQATSTPLVQATGGDRFLSYYGRIPEHLLQGWFSISAIALSINHADSEAIGQLLAYLALISVVSIKCFYDIACIYVPWARQVRRFKKWHPGKLAVLMSCHIIGMTVFLIRLVSVWM
mmetsp:Transcript_26686/g.46219  ORF Transcript_26686/g.46219 Transcript_26686/m.46219 type:complete len:377 (-) Transcript_26686:375-1505(-)